MRKSKQKHTLAMALSAVMILNTMPIFADEVNIEVSEYIHDADCNHIEGQPCIHEHTEDCHTLNCIDETEEHNHNDECFELNCTHLHNADCEYVEAKECSCMKQAEENKEINCTLTEGCNQLSEHEGECEIDTLIDNSQQVKMITDWAFIDAENLVEGVLALPGVNVTQQIDVEALVQMLPTEISVQINEEPSTLKISDWTCPEYKKDMDDNWPISGEYTFIAELPEGYECETMPSVKVLLGGAELYDIEIGQTAGAFTVIGDGSQYEWNNPVLTIKSGATLTIQNTNPNEPTKHRIIVASGAKNVNITLNGVNINLKNDFDACAFDMTDAEVNLTLAQGSENVLLSNGDRAGLEVPKGAKLTIKGSGTLIAESGLDGAGIGGKGTGEKGFNGGNITIMENVIVTAKSLSGAGIGGGMGNNGNGGDGGTVTIQGNAKVTATSIAGAGIGGGMSNADANAKGGDGGTVIIQGNAQVTAKSSSGAGIGGGKGNGVDGGNGGMVKISGEGTKVTTTGNYDIGGGRGTNGHADGGKLSVTEGATLEMTTNGTNVKKINQEYKSCIIIDKGVQTHYNENSEKSAENPKIINRPQNQTTLVGSPVTLSVNASVSDGGELSYEWYSNTINDTATGTKVESKASYTPPVDALGTTYYYVVITNTRSDLNDLKPASVKSNVVSVTVTAPSTSSSSNGTSVKNTYSTTKDMINQTISSSNLKNLIRNKKTLTLNSNKVSMSFEPDALKSILDVIPSSARKITFKAVPADLSAYPNASAMIGNHPVYDFLISYKDSRGREHLVDANFPAGSVGIALNYTPTANETAGNLFMVAIDDKGNVTWLDYSSYGKGQVIAEALHFSLYGIAYKTESPTYTDIKDHWAKADIEFVVARGLLSGNDNLFTPDSLLTRGMFIKALEQLAGIDSQPTHRLDEALTREQIALILADYAEQLEITMSETLSAIKYADQSKISTMARKAVKQMQRAGVVRGKDGNQFDPQGKVTKAEGAAILHRFMEAVIDPNVMNGWLKNDSGHWHYYQKGKAVTGWQTINKLRYYFNDDGEMYEGWKYDKKKWYYWNNDGAVIGWKFINGKWYYFESDGAMASNTWIEGYELGADGVMKTNN